MKAHIYNCTHQNQMMNVRLPEVGRMSVPVEGYQQIVFPKDLNMIQFESLLGQMRKYGMLTVEEAALHRPAGVPLVWLVNLDKQISPKIISDIMGKNTGVLDEQGREMRRMAALATRHNMNRDAHTPMAADKVELSIEEEPGSGQTNTAGLMAEGHRIETRNEGAPTSGRRGRR